ALAANLSLEDPQLRARRRLPGGVRERIEEPLAQAPSREPELGEVELAEVADRLLVILAPESLEGGARLEDRVEPKPEEEPLERGRELVVRALHFACARKEAREPDLLAFALGVHEMTPVMERLDVIAHVAQASEDRLEARAFQARSESAGVVELRARTERLEGVAEVIDPGAKLARIGRRAL